MFARPPLRKCRRVPWRACLWGRLQEGWALAASRNDSMPCYNYMCGNTLTTPHAPPVCYRACDSKLACACACACACVCLLSFWVIPSPMCCTPEAWQAPWPRAPSTLCHIPRDMSCPNTLGVCSCLLWSWAFWLYPTMLETSTCMGVCICPAPSSPFEHTKRHSLSLWPHRGFLLACLGL